MSATDQEEIIEQLRALLAGRGDGIDLDTPFHWAIEGLKQPVPFFEHLPALLHTNLEAIDREMTVDLSTQRTRASRFAQRQIDVQWWLAPAADADCPV
jgi:hypothetical protein